MICFIVLPFLMPNMIMQSVPSSSRRTFVERLIGLVEYEQWFSSDCFHPLPYEKRQGVVQTGTEPRGGGLGGTLRQLPGPWVPRERGSYELRVRAQAGHCAGTLDGSGLRQAVPIKGGQPSMPVSSVQPEAQDNLLEALCSASIEEEHRTIMSAVVEKVQSTKNGLTEACASVLTGFEVSNQNIRKYYRIDSSP